VRRPIAADDRPGVAVLHPMGFEALRLRDASTALESGSTGDWTSATLDWQPLGCLWWSNGRRVPGGRRPNPARAHR